MRSRRSLVLGAILALFLIAGVSYADNWAVIVGINKFEKIRPNLNFCVPDAKLFQKALLEHSGFQADHIKTLFDEEATKANIQDAMLNWLAKNVQPGDKAVFYFSGHGVQFRDVNGDEEDGYDEALVAHDSWLVDTKFIIDEELSRWVNRIPTTNKIVILDCCHSGTGMRAIDSDVQVRQYYPEKPIEISQSRATEPAEPQFEKTSLLSACDAHQVALESRPLGHGVFTYYLSESLRGAADKDSDGRVSVREVADYAVQKIKRDGWEQDPQLEGEYSDQYLVGEGEIVEPYGIITAIEEGDHFTVALGQADEATVGSLYSVFDAETTTTEGLGKGLIEILEVGVKESKAQAFQVEGSIEVGDRIVEYRKRHAFENLRVRFASVDGEALDTNRSKLRLMLAEQLGQRSHIKVIAETGEWADSVLKVTLEPNTGSAETYRVKAHLYNPQRQTEGREYSLLFGWDKKHQAVATLLDMRNIGGELEGAYALKRLSKLTTPTRAPVKVNLEVNKGNHGIYSIGDELSVTATVDKDCWLTLLDIGSSGSITVLFPNKHQPNNKLLAGQSVQVPAQGYRVRVGGPPGSEVIKAIATLDPLNLDELSVEDLSQQFNSLSGDASGSFSRALTSKDLFVEPEDAERWAEASVHFRIAPDKLYKQERAVLELSLLE